MVSILARPEGRAQLRSVRLPCDRRGVSILARPEGRAQPRAASRSIWRVVFQSSPGPKAERNPAQAKAFEAAAQGFNPRPARRPSATSDPRRLHVLHDAVSILARPEGRAQHPTARYFPLDTREFQSSPGPKAERNSISNGASGPDSAFQSSPGPKAERNLVGLQEYAQMNSKFQSSPGPKAERNSRPAPGAGTPVAFQSSPGPKAERNPAGGGARKHRNACFNPRPARRPSATVPTSMARGLRPGFNPRPA